ncbi:aldo/keto reductase [Mucilaginibacter sp. SJ]|uniref:aldo/keto reductase n=1 Tax=Mucilaginibacter sp. SJ TaxID=3029053 RepID=UPI0023A98A0F|nr:aldo/keto reductase [Mucilaginibacter sp. SJ]WEA00622.1 aldo/keto reductase [Mucilaginibacter sp. SJ]
MSSQKTPSTDLEFPSIIFGTSSLGNLYTELDDKIKLAIVKECINQTSGKVYFDSAGKYGAGLALESLGASLASLNTNHSKIVISNKLGWLRTKLTSAEPTFEPGIWKGLKHDAIQHLGYEQIMDCFRQGNTLLKGFVADLVSVHDPDEYLEIGRNNDEINGLYYEVLDSYKALSELKQRGKVKAVGVGAKNWRVIERIHKDVKLDWVMIANSMTIKSHPIDLLDFMRELESEGVKIVNSAVFHSGFLTGGDYYDYKFVSREDQQYSDLFEWRDLFFSCCLKYGVKPAHACVQFALKAPGVVSIALNTTNPERVKENVKMVHEPVPVKLWDELMEKGLISSYFFKNQILKKA